MKFDRIFRKKSVREKISGKNAALDSLNYDLSDKNAKIIQKCIKFRLLVANYDSSQSVTSLKLQSFLDVGNCACC